MSATEQDVVMAVLALDSYNHGYNKGMNVPATENIDGATIITDSSALSGIDKSPTSFYAIAYNWNGQAVISYRGTVFNNGPDTQDIWFGWAFGGGFYRLGVQALEGAVFFQRVAEYEDPSLQPGGADPSDWSSANILLTGHSLGGGLAGFVGSIYGQTAVLFDNEPFELAAENAYDDAHLESFLPSFLRPDGNLIYGAQSGNPYPPNYAGLTAFATQGEILGYLRGFGGQSLPVESFDPWDGSVQLSATVLHSMSLLTLLAYASVNSYTQWFEAGSALAQAEFRNDSIARAIGITASAVGGSYTPPTALLAAIAYSAAPNSSPYGTTAAASYFSDADSLGEFALDTRSSTGLLSGDDVLKSLAEMVVQYAGDQAWTAGQNGGSNGNANSNGALSYNDNILTINIDPSQWVSTFKTAPSNSTTPNVIGLGDFANSVFANFASANGVSSSEAAYIQQVAKGDPALVHKLNQITLVEASLNGGEVSGAAAAATAKGPGGALLIGQLNNGTIAGSPTGDDIIVGGATINEGNGNDIILTSKKTTINPGTGDNITYADPAGGADVTFDYTSTKGSNLIIGDGSGGDTFNFDNANQAAFTVVWGGAGDDNYEFDTTAGSASPNVLLLDISGVTADNIGDLNVSKLEAYVDKTYQLNSSSPTILVLNAADSDKLYYNGTVLGSPASYQVGGQIGYYNANTSDDAVVAQEQLVRAGFPMYDPATGLEYAMPAAFVVNSNNPLSLYQGSPPSPSSPQTIATIDNALASTKETDDDYSLALDSVGYVDYDQTFGTPPSTSSSSNYGQDGGAQAPSSVTIPVLSIGAAASGSLTTKVIDPNAQLGSTFLYHLYGYEGLSGSGTGAGSAGLNLLNFQNGQFGVTLPNAPAETTTYTTTEYEVTSWASGYQYLPYPSSYEVLEPPGYDTTYLGVIVGTKPSQLGPAITQYASTTTESGSLNKENGYAAPTLNIDDYLLPGSAEAGNGGGGGGGGDPPVAQFLDDQYNLDSSGKGIAITDTAAMVSSAFDALDDDPNVASITLTDSGVPTLDLTASQAVDDVVAFGKITNTSYAVAISDSGDDVAADIDALNSDASVTSITLTGQPTLTLSAAQALDDQIALSKIANSTYNIVISDTAEDVSTAFDQLNADADVSSISLIDTVNPSLDLTVEEAIDDAQTIGKVANPDFSITIYDSAANILSEQSALAADAAVSGAIVVDKVANVLADKTALEADPLVKSITIIDTVANVLAGATDLDDFGLVNAVYVVDTASNALSQASALANDRAITAVVVSDSSANVSIAFGALSDDASLTGIELTDTTSPTLSLDVAQVVDDGTTFGKIENSSFAIAITDTAADVAANIGALEADDDVASIELTGSGTPTLVLTVAEVLDDTAVLSKISGSYAIAISDTAANVAANIGAIDDDSLIDRINLTDAGTPSLTMTAAQTLAYTKALGEIATPGVTITVSDNAANVSGAFAALVDDASVGAIDLTDAGVPTLDLTVDEALDDGGLLGKISPANYQIATFGSVSNILAQSPALTSDARVGSVTVVDTIDDIRDNSVALATEAKIVGYDVVDTSADVSANIDVLAEMPDLDDVLLTDSETPSLSISIAQWLDDGKVLRDIINPSVDIAISGAAADVATNIDILESDSRVSSITLTDAGTPTLPLSSAQLTADSSELDKITNANFDVDVTDSAWNVSKAFDALNAETHLSSITLAGSPVLSLTVAQALDDARALGAISEVYEIAVTDTAANVTAHLSALDSDASVITISVKDSAAAIADDYASLVTSDKVVSIGVEDNVANVLAESSALSGDTEVSGATVVDTAQNIVNNQSELESDAFVRSITVADTIANIDSNSAALGGDPKITSIEPTGAGTLMLSAVQALDDLSVALPVAVSDTAANVSAFIDALNKDGNVESITLTGVGTPTLTLTATQAIDDTLALGEISGLYHVALSDTAAEVAHNFAALDADAKLKSITLTDSGTPTLDLDVSEALDDTLALSDITGSYDISITDTAQAVFARESQVLADAAVVSISINDTAANVLYEAAAIQADPHISSVAISDTAAAISQDFGAIAGAPKLAAIDLTSGSTLTLTIAEALDDYATLSAVKGFYIVDVIGTISDVASHLAALSGEASTLAISGDALEITIADTGANIAGAFSSFGGSGSILDDDLITSVEDISTSSAPVTVAYFLANQDALDAQGDIEIADTVANVSASFDALNDDGQVNSISLTDGGTPELTLSALQVSQDTRALQLIENVSYEISIVDSARDVASNLNSLEANVRIQSISLTDAGAPTLSISVAQALNDQAALAEISTPHAIALVDSPSDILGITQAQARVLKAAGYDDIYANAAITLPAAEARLLSADDITINGGPVFIADDDTATWTGAVDDSWNNSGNWSDDQLPGTDESILIPAGLQNEPTVTDASTVNVDTGIVNQGLVVLASHGDGTNLVIGSSSHPTVALSGGGAVELSDNFSNRIYGGAGGATLDNLNNTIEGAGQIFSLTIANDGLIEATQAAGLEISNAAIENGEGGALEADGGALALDNADVIGGTLATVGSSLIEAGGSGTQLDGTQTEGAVTIAAGATLQVDDGANLTLDGASGGGDSIVNQGVISLVSTGFGTNLIIGSGNGPTVALTGGGVLELSDNSSNRIYAGVSGATLVNVDNTIKGAGQISSLTFVNDSLIEATEASGLEISNSAIEAGAGGELAANGGQLVLSNADVVGGTLVSSGASTIETQGGGNQLDGTQSEGAVTIATGATLQVDNGANLTLDGASGAGDSLVDKGVLSVASQGFGTDLIIGSGNGPTVALRGGGVVELSNNFNNRIYGGVSGATLDDIDDAIEGAGQIFNLTLVNESLVEATQTAALEISNATIETGGGGELEANGGQLILSNADVIGGLLANSGASFIEAQGGGTQLDGTQSEGAVAIAAGATLQVDNGANLTLDGASGASGASGAIVDQGEIALASDGFSTDLIVGSGSGPTVALSGGGEIALSDDAQNRIYGGVGGATLHNIDDTIEGAGQIFNLTIVNNNVIAATEAAGLSISNAAIENGVGGQLVADGGNLILNNAYVAGGTLVTDGSNIIEAQGSGTQIDGSQAEGVVTIAANSTLEIADNSNLTLDGAAGAPGSIVNAGEIDLASQGSHTDLLIGSGNGEEVTLSGAGDVWLAGSTNSRIFSDYSDVTLVNVDDTIEGEGQILGGDGFAILNQDDGVIGAKYISTLTVSDVAIDNQGILEARNGSTLRLDDSLSNLTADPNNSGGQELTGGGYDVVDALAGTSAGPSAIVINQGDGGITTLDAIVRLRGDDSGIVTNGEALSSSLVDIASDGDLRLFYGVNSDTQQVFDDSHSLEIAGGAHVYGAILQAQSITIDSGGALAGGNLSILPTGDDADESVSGAEVVGPRAQIIAPIVNNGAIRAVDGGLLLISGAVSGEGRALITGGTTLEFAGAVGAGQQIIFSGTEGVGPETLQIDSTDVAASGDFQAPIMGFAVGDTIDLDGLSDATGYTFVDDVLTLNFADGASASLTMTGLQDSIAFDVTGDGKDGTQITLGMSAGLANALGMVSGVTYANDDELSGAAAAGASVLFYEGDNLLGSTTATSTGSWSFAPAGLPPGVHDIQVKVVNADDDLLGSVDVVFTQTDAVSVAQYLQISDPSDVSIIDSVGNVAANLDALNAGAGINQIELTDAPAQTLDLTAASALSDGAALSKIVEPYSISVSDTAADVAANLDALAALPTLVSITLTDPGTPTLTLSAAQAANDSSVLGKISNSAFAIDIQDTAANVDAVFNALIGVPKLASITLTDAGAPTLALTIAQTISGAALLQAISNSNYVVAIEDTAANVSGDLDALNGDAHVSAITLTDGGALSLTVAQALEDSTALSEITNANYQIAIVDTAANISANFTALKNDSRVTSIRVSDGAANAVQISIAQALDDAAAVDEITGTHSIQLTDTPDDVASVTQSQADALEQAGYTSIYVTGAVLLSAAEAGVFSSDHITLEGGPVSVQGQATWTGAASDDWNDASNWSAGVPTPSDQIDIPSGSTATVESGETAYAGVAIDDQGTLSLAASGNWANLVIGSASNPSVTLNGGGVLSMSNSPYNHIYGAGSDDTLANVDDTIEGAGWISGITLVNDGLIDATQSDGLEIQSATVENGVDGHLEANGGNLELNGVTVVGGALTTEGSSLIQVQGSGVQLEASPSDGSVEITSGSTLQIGDGTNLQLDGTSAAPGGLINQGVLAFASGGNWTDLRIGSGDDATIELTGGGEIALDSIGRDRIYGIDNSDTLVNVDDTIEGSGEIYGLTLQNQGLIEATDPAGLALSNLTLQDTSGGLLEANGGNVYLQSLTIEGGPLTSANGNVIETSGNGTLFDDTISASPLTITSGSTVQISDGTNLQLEGTSVASGDLINRGFVAFASGGNWTDLRIGSGDDATIELTGGGEIALDSTGRDRIYGFDNGDTLLNVDDTIEGSGEIYGLTLENQGLIEATGAMGLALSSLTLEDSGGGLLEANGGNVYLQNLTIEGGPLTSQNGGVIETSGNGTIFDDTIAAAPLTITSGSTVKITDGTNLQLDATSAAPGDLINQGAVAFVSGGNWTDLRIASGDDATVEFTGGGEIALDNTGRDRIYGVDNGDTLLNVNNTIAGAGQIFGLTLENQGLIEATGSAGLSLYNLTLEDTDDGLLEADGGNIYLQNITIDGGPLTSANGYVIETSGNGTVFDDTIAAAPLTITTGSTVQINDGENLQLDGTSTAQGDLVNQGVVAFASGGNWTDFRIGSGDDATVELTGGGQIALDNTGRDRIYGVGARDTLLNVNNTIAGAGEIYGLTLQNEGLIEATDPNGLGLSNMTLQEAGGGLLEANGGNIYLQNLTIDGGPLTSANGSVIETSGNGTVFDDTLSGSPLTLTTGTTVQINDGENLQLEGTSGAVGDLVNQGVVAFHSGGNWTDLRIGSGDDATVELTGGGEIALDNTGRDRIYGVANDDTLLNVNNTIAGGGQIELGLDNAAGGTILANSPDAALFLEDVASITNQGLLEASGGSLVVDDAVSGSGSALITDAGAMRFTQAFDQNVAFEGAGSLSLAQSYAGTVTGFGDDDSLDLTRLAYNAADQLVGPSGGGSAWSVEDGSGNVLALLNIQLSSSASGELALSSDNNGGTLLRLAAGT